MIGKTPSTIAKAYIQAQQQIAISTILHPPQVWDPFLDEAYCILKRTYLEMFFHYISNL